MEIDPAGGIRRTVRLSALVIINFQGWRYEHGDISLQYFVRPR
jgi:hypothetical protein